MSLVEVVLGFSSVRSRQKLGRAWWASLFLFFFFMLLFKFFFLLFLVLERI